MEDKHENESEANDLENKIDLSQDEITLGKFIGKDDEFEYFQEEVDVDENANVVCENENMFMDDPASYIDAMNSYDSEWWRKAINKELDSHERCGTWKLVKRSILSERTSGENSMGE